MEEIRDLIKKKLLGGFSNLGLSILALAAAGDHSTASKSGRAAIEDEDRLGSEVKKLANSSEKPQQMSVPYHLSFLVSHRFHELNHPYTRV